jgi:hypothetical protein
MKKSVLSLSLALAFSLLLNLLFFVNYHSLPTYQLGILKKDLNITSFDNDSKILFKLPKGMIVMDNSPQGIASIGLFGSNRITFSVIASRSWVNYSQSKHLRELQSLYESSD